MNKDPDDVSKMFDGVASRYDFLNDLLSLGRTKAWRKSVTAIISPKSRVLVVSSLDPQIYGGRIRTIGGHGFINKTANSDIIMAACIAVSQGYTFFLTNQSGQALSTDEEIISSFSPREFQVLKYLADGYGNCDISEFLHISNKTVSTYKNRIYRKLGVNNIAELISFCRHNKVVDI